MRSRRTRSLGEIAHVRALQRQAGEIRLSRATAVLDDQQRLQQTEQQEQDDRERAWAQTLDGRLDVTLSHAWSTAMAQGAHRLFEVERGVAQARVQTRLASEGLQAAQAKAEVAEGLEKRAHRQDRRVRDGRALLEISDLFSRRGAYED